MKLLPSVGDARDQLDIAIFTTALHIPLFPSPELFFYRRFGVDFISLFIFHFLFPLPSEIPPTNMSNLQTLITQLQTSLNQQQLDHAASLLSQAKCALLQQNALIPTPSTPPQLLSQARHILELGAITSIRRADAPSFTRYYQQLQPFYDAEQHIEATAGGKASGLDLSTSQRSKITGLYLLLLLSVGNNTDFHIVLEGLVVEASLKGLSVEDDPYIKYPVELERSLMEGSYDKVWRETKSDKVPTEDFGLFSNVSLFIIFYLDVLLFLYEYCTDVPTRSLLAPSAERSPTARKRPTRPSPSPTQRTSSFSILKAPSSNSLRNAVGFCATAGYTSLRKQRRARRLFLDSAPRRISLSQVVRSSRTRLDTQESWRPLFKAILISLGLVLYSVRDVVLYGCLRSMLIISSDMTPSG